MTVEGWDRDDVRRVGDRPGNVCVECAQFTPEGSTHTCPYRPLYTDDSPPFDAQRFIAIRGGIKPDAPTDNRKAS